MLVTARPWKPTSDHVAPASIVLYRPRSVAANRVAGSCGLISSTETRARAGMPTALADQLAPPSIVLYTRPPPARPTYRVSGFAGSSTIDDARSRSAAGMPASIAVHVEPRLVEWNTPPVAGVPAGVWPSTPT